MQGMDEDGLDYALNRAIDAFYNGKAWFRALQVRLGTAQPLIKPLLSVLSMYKW